MVENLLSTAKRLRDELLEFRSVIQESQLQIAMNGSLSTRSKRILSRNFAATLRDNQKKLDEIDVKLSQLQNCDLWRELHDRVQEGRHILFVTDNQFATTTFHANLFEALKDNTQTKTLFHYPVDDTWLPDVSKEGLPCDIILSFSTRDCQIRYESNELVASSEDFVTSRFFVLCNGARYKSEQVFVTFDVDRIKMFMFDQLLDRLKSNTFNFHRIDSDSGTFFEWYVSCNGIIFFNK